MSVWIIQIKTTVVVCLNKHPRTFIIHIFISYKKEVSLLNLSRIYALFSRPNFKHVMKKKVFSNHFSNDI